MRGGKSNAVASCSKWPLCDPSQNGLLAERPHLHKDTTVRPCKPYTLPLTSTISKSPSSFADPLLFIVILILLISEFDSFYLRTSYDILQHSAMFFLILDLCVLRTVYSPSIIVNKLIKDISHVCKFSKLKPPNNSKNYSMKKTCNLSAKNCQF